MKLVPTALAAAGLGLALLAAPAVPDGDIRIDDLRLGEYWYGAEIDKTDLVGKVVLFEIWGS